MKTQSIRFTQGLSHLDSSPLSAPRSLKNCRVSKMGELQVMKDPVVLGDDTTYPTGPKPWVLHEYRDAADNDVFNWLTANNGVNAAAQYRDRLYVSKYDQKLFERRNRKGDVVTVPPHIVGVNQTNYWGEDGEMFETDPNTDQVKGVTARHAVDYLFIPYTENDEAGRWFYATYIAAWDESFDDFAIDGTVNTLIPDFEILVSNHTSYVEVYRSLEYRSVDTTVILDQKTGRRRFWLIGDRLERTNEVDVNASPSGGYYYADKLSVENFDSAFDPNADYFDNPLNWQDTNWWPFDIFREDDEGNLGNSDSVGPVLDRSINMWGVLDHLYIDDGLLTKEYPNPVSKVIYNHGGKFLFGGVNVPLKQPQISNIIQSQNPLGYGGLFDDFTRKQVMIQYEYSTPFGPVYGPPMSLSEIHAVSIPFQGESAVIVFVHDGTNYRYFERLTPTASLKYVSRHQYEKRDSGSWEEAADTTYNFAWTSIGFDNAGWPNGPETTGPYAWEEYIEIDNAVFMSAQNRPWEMTYQNAPTPDDRPIRAITGARLSEAEGLQAYDFYTFTDRNVYVASRDTDTIIFTPVINGVGVKHSEVDGQALVTTVQSGVVFVGTDDKVYFLTGRQYVQLDEMIPDVFAVVKDIAFTSEKNEVLIHEGDNIWVYNFDQQGWIGHIDAKTSGANTTTNIGFSEQHRDVLFRLDDGSVYRWVDWDEAGTLLDASVESQKIHTVSNIAVKATKVDYDPVVYEGTYQAQEGAKRITRQTGPAWDAVRDKLATIAIEGAGEEVDGDPTFLHTLISSIDGEDAILADYLSVDDPDNLLVLSGAMYWGPSATLTIHVENHTLQRSYDLVFPVPPERLRYPKIKGRRLRIELSGFELLREILILFEGDLETD